MHSNELPDFCYCLVFIHWIKLSTYILFCELSKSFSLHHVASRWILHISFVFCCLCFSFISPFCVPVIDCWVENDIKQHFLWMVFIYLAIFSRCFFFCNNSQWVWESSLPYFVYIADSHLLIITFTAREREQK